MKTNRIIPATPADRHGELATALQALARLGGQVVAQCPDRTCPICTAVVTVAA